MSNVSTLHRQAQQKRMCFPSATAFSTVHNAGFIGKGGLKSHEMSTEEEQAAEQAAEQAEQAALDSMAAGEDPQPKGKSLLDH